VPGEVVLDAESANSPFSAAQLRHIGMPGIEVQQMPAWVCAEIVAVTRQVPRSNSFLPGKVYPAEK
jgi:hypothetical protein